MTIQEVLDNAERCEDEMDSMGFIMDFAFDASDSDMIELCEEFINRQFSFQNHVGLITAINATSNRNPMTLLSFGFIKDNGVGKSEEWNKTYHKLYRSCVRSILRENKHPIEDYRITLKHIFKDTSVEVDI